MVRERGPSLFQKNPENPLKRAAKKILPYVAVASMSSGDMAPHPAAAEWEELQPTVVEQLYQGKLTERRAHSGDSEFTVSPESLALVDTINALPESQISVPEPLRIEIKKESFDVAKLIKRYGKKHIARDVVRILFDTNPTSLFQTLEYLETLPWGSSVIEQLFLATPRSSMDYGLFFHPVIQTSEDRSVQTLKDLFEGAYKHGGEELTRRAILLIDEVVNGSLSIEGAIALAQAKDTALYEKRLKYIASHENALGILDVLGELEPLEK